MRLALLGTRGIPARYGGFETFAEELSARLAARGHDVTVYCRRRHPEPFYRGVRLTYLPTLRRKYLDTVFHAALSTLHLLLHRRDAALYCNAANALFTLLPRLAGMPVALNVDGLERHRRKWNLLGKTWYRLSEWLATILPNVVVTDAQRIADYYLARFRKPSEFIPYGADTTPVHTRAILDRLGLASRRYFLYVSRLEPENNALLVRQSFERLATDLKLAIVGDAPYAAGYIERVRATTDPRVIFPGAIYGPGYHELQAHSFAYIHATEVGGTHPALVEALGRGALVLYLDTPENAEVAEGAGLPFDHENLTARLEQALAMSGQERESWREKARRRAAERYSWEAVTDAYEQLFRRLLENRGK
jgi:glycosyltransferase involved in cell wall biosynthesis